MTNSPSDRLTNNQPKTPGRLDAEAHNPGPPPGARLDTVAAIFGALVPIGLVIGSVGFEATMGIAVLCWLIRCLRCGKGAFRRAFSHPLVLPLAAWYAVILISLIWNGPGSKGWAHDVVIFRFGLFIVAMLDISRRKPVAAWMLWGLAASVGFAVLNLGAAYTFGHDFFGNPLSRYTLKVGAAGRIAATNAYAIPFFFGWALTDLRPGNKRRALIAGVGLVAAAHLLQTRIRTAMLATTIGLIFLIYRRFRKHIPWWTCLLAVAGGIAAVACLIAADYRVLNLASMYDRIYYWKVSLVMWLRHPVVGVGVSAWRDVYRRIASSGGVSPFIAPNGTIWHSQIALHAHNLLLMLLSTTGVAGTAAFVWLYIRATRIAFSREKGFRFGMAAWPAILIGDGLTGCNIYDSAYLCLLAFLLVMIACSDKDDDDVFPARARRGERTSGS